MVRFQAFDDRAAHGGLAGLNLGHPTAVTGPAGARCNQHLKGPATDKASPSGNVLI